MSVKKDLGIIFGLFFIVVLLLVFGGSNTSTTFFQRRESTGSASLYMERPLSIKDTNFTVEVADTAEKRRLGLGKRESLKIDRGMLFVFDQTANYTFWMKDMKFAIDIIWLDENKKVVYMATDVPSEPDKKDAELKKYNLGVQAKYVLEINAGLAASHNIQVGDSAIFSL